MLFKLGLKNLKQNPIINILIVFQMTVVFIITISMVSTIVSRFKFYTPIDDYLNSNGTFYSVSNGLNPTTGVTLRTTDELYDLLEGEKEIIASFSAWLSYNQDNSVFTSYDDKFIQMYTPELESGCWFDLNKTSSDVIQVVVSENPYGFKTGDKITLDSFGIEINAEIIGILKPNTKIIGFSPSKNGKYDCRNTFINYNYSIEEKPLFILSQSELIDKKVTLQLNGPVYVTYENNISESVIEKNNGIMTQMMTLNITPFDSMKKNSLDYIFQQIYILLPILICILILTLVSAISVSALSAKRQLKNYAVYYICGLKWKQCALINFYSALISVLVSFVLSIISIIVIIITDSFGETVIELGMWQILSCILIMTIYVLLSVLLPISIIGNNTPNQVLRSN